MAWLPRREILSRLEDYGIRLICSEVIDDADVHAIWDVIDGLEEEITWLEQRIEDLHAQDYDNDEARAELGRLVGALEAENAILKDALQRLASPGSPEATDA